MTTSSLYLPCILVGLGYLPDPLITSPGVSSGGSCGGSASVGDSGLDAGGTSHIGDAATDAGWLCEDEGTVSPDHPAEGGGRIRTRL